KAAYAAATFPYVSTNNSPAKLSLPMLVTMSRVAYFPISGPADFQNRYVTDATNTPYFWRNQLQADMIFQFDDDLSVDVNKKDQSQPAMQIFSSFPNTATPSKRQSDGRMSWMATLVPKIDMYSGNASDEFILSVIMFYDRPSYLRLAQGTGALDANSTEYTLE